MSIYFGLRCGDPKQDFFVRTATVAEFETENDREEAIGAQARGHPGCSLPPPSGILSLRGS